jgi:tetratricopeptide (TPR) repeat protein
MLAPMAARAAGESGSSAKGDSGAPAPSGSVRRDPKNQTALSEFMATCIDGNKQYASRDFKSALATYKKAITLDPKNALGHYLAGEALLADNNLSEAEAMWKQAELTATDEDPFLRARVLFVKADLYERQKRWSDARAAWQAYGEYAGKFGDAGVGFPASGQSRVQAIDAMTKLNAESDKVKQRIKDTADGGVFTNVDGSPG